MAIEVFNRFEYKYLVDENQYGKLLDIIGENMTADSYNIDGKPYTISNIYYDTLNNDFISRSSESPLYKEKLRLRGYGVPKLTGICFLEIKKKYRGIVNKRRTEFVLKDAYKFIRENTAEKKENLNIQVLNEIEYLTRVNPVIPKVYIAYDRVAYFGKDISDLRVSFDSGIRTRRYDLRLEMGDHGTYLLPEGYRVMEIKSLYGIPLWFTSELSRLNIARRSFSKYGTEYSNYLRRKQNVWFAF